MIKNRISKWRGVTKYISTGLVAAAFLLATGCGEKDQAGMLAARRGLSPWQAVELFTLEASDRYWDEDLIDPPVVMEEGMIEVPQGPGIGVEVVEKRVDKVSLDRVTVKA